MRAFAAGTLALILLWLPGPSTKSLLAATPKLCGMLYAAPSPTRNEGLLTGRVVDAATGAGIVSYVTIIGQSAVWVGGTDPSGVYAARLPAGSYRNSVQKAGYREATRKAVVRPGRMTRRDFALRPLPAVQRRSEGPTAGPRGPLPERPVAQECAPGITSPTPPSTSGSQQTGEERSPAPGPGALTGSGLSAGGMPASAGGVGGTGTAVGGTLAPETGAISAPAPPPLAAGPVRSRIGSDGWLEINGQPILMVNGHKIFGWIGRDETKYLAMKHAGFTSFEGNWFNDGADAQWIYDNWGLYFWAPATQDLGRSQDALFGPGINTPAGRAIIAVIVNRYKHKPYLIAWKVVNEYNASGMPIREWQQAKNFILTLDTDHLLGDVYVLTHPENPFQAHDAMDIPFTELALGWGSPEQALGYLLGSLRAQEEKWQAGHRFVRGVSTTPIPEFLPGVTNHRVWDRPELYRFFLAQVIFNVRAFEILWGPNQVGAGRTPEMHGWPGGWADIDNRWGWTLDVTTALTTTLRPVIMSPGLFVRISSASPAFEIPSQFNNFLYSGLYAAQKIVEGVTYIGAVNTESRSLSVVIPASGATAVNVITGAQVPITNGAIRETIPGLTARIYRIH